MSTENSLKTESPFKRWFIYLQFHGITVQYCSNDGSGQDFQSEHWQFDSSAPCSAYRIAPKESRIKNQD